MANIFKQSYSMHSIHIYFQTYEKLVVRVFSPCIYYVKLKNNTFSIDFDNN